QPAVETLPKREHAPRRCDDTPWPVRSEARLFGPSCPEGTNHVPWYWGTMRVPQSYGRDEVDDRDQVLTGRGAAGHPQGTDGGVDRRNAPPCPHSDRISSSSPACSVIGWPRPASR